jgi:hypothetical protein
VALCRIAEQEAWLNQQVAAHPSDSFWQVVGLLQSQLDGLYEGYAAAIAAAQAAGQQVEVLTRDDVLFLNSNGEHSSSAAAHQALGFATGTCIGLHEAAHRCVS